MPGLMPPEKSLQYNKAIRAKLVGGRNMDKLFIVIGLLLFIAGGIGLILTNANLESGNIDWILGNLTYATFAIVGLILVVTLIVASWETRY